MTATAARMAEKGAEVSRILLPSLFNIFRLWKLTGREQMTLLGLTNEKTLYNWKRHPEKAQLTPDLIERASYLLGIYKSLQILFPTQENADQWLTRPNDNPLFNGLPPLQRLLAGQVMDLATVRQHLDAVRGA